MPPKSANKRKAVGASKSGPLAKIPGNAVKKPAAKTGPKRKSSKKTADAATATLSTSRPPSQPEPHTATASTESSTRKTSERVNYMLFCRLRVTQDPTITRLLSVPSTLTFGKLHHVLQVAFGWASCHMFTFAVEELPEDDTGNLRAWPKRLLSITPHPLGLDGEDTFPEKACDEVSLADVFEHAAYEGKTGVTYEYDMGDGWDHDIVFLGRESQTARKVMAIPDSLPVVCLGGEGHPCAEDSGGPPGFEDLKDLFAKPRGRDPDGRKQWYKTACANGDPKGFHPYRWDVLDVNDALANLTESRGFL